MALKKEQGVVPRFNEDKRETTVDCWTDIFIYEYLAPKLVKSKKPDDMKKINDWVKSFKLPLMPSPIPKPTDKVAVL